MFSGRALLTLDHDHTILRLGPAATWDQVANPATDTPSVAAPAVTDSFAELANILRTTGAFCWIDPESDLPELGAFDAEVLPHAAMGAAFTFANFGAKMVRIGYNPVWVPPMAQPCLFPPLSRYIFGTALAGDLYDFGGETDNANLTPVDNISDFLVLLSFSTKKPRDVNYPHFNTWRYRTKSTLTHAQADAANTRNVNWPAMTIHDTPISYAIFAGTLTNLDVRTFVEYEVHRGPGERALLAINPIATTAKTFAAGAGGWGFRIALAISSDGVGDGTLTATEWTITEGGYYV